MPIDKQWEQKLEQLSDELEEWLSDTDKKHKEEVLDILELLKARLSMYVAEYGLIEDSQRQVLRLKQDRFGTPKPHLISPGAAFKCNILVN